MPLLNLMSMRGCVDFLSYHDDGDLVGMSYSIRHRDHVFVLYVAVRSDMQSRGYGSAMVSHIRSVYRGLPLTLNVEPMGPDYDDNDLRKRRFAFYQRNGFRDTGYRLVDGDVVYTILSTADEFVPEDYLMVLRSLTMGFNVPRVESV